jgi:hypothetical protein
LKPSNKKAYNRTNSLSKEAKLPLNQRHLAK